MSKEKIKLELLRMFSFNEDEFNKWFEKKNNAFDGLSPKEVIENGEYHKLAQMIDQLNSGAAN